MKSTEEMLQAAVQQLQTAEQARLTSETDPARRQLLHLLYAREAAALQSMTLVRAEIPATQKEAADFPVRRRSAESGCACALADAAQLRDAGKQRLDGAIRAVHRCAVGIALRRHREHCERHAPQASQACCGGG